MTDRAADRPGRLHRLLPWRRSPALLLLASLLAPLLLLAACDDTPPPRTDFPPLTYDYLGKLRLAVATVDIDNAFAKQDTGGPEHVEELAPVQPVDALKRMAEDRLIPAATSGHAVFVIEDASLTRAPGGFEGSMRVRLDVTTSDGTKAGFAEARVDRTYSSVDTFPASTRAALYDLVKLMMSDMNVELEFQVKQRLHDYLQTGDGIAPAPAPVQAQDLNTGAPLTGPSDPGTASPGPSSLGPSLPNPPAVDAPAPSADQPPALPPQDQTTPGQPAPEQPAQ
jgi:hypothetical protein